MRGRGSSRVPPGATRWRWLRDSRLLRVFAAVRGGCDGVVPDSEDAEASLREMLAAALEANRQLSERQQAELTELREMNARLLERVAEREAELGGGQGVPGGAAADGVRPEVGEEPPGTAWRRG